MRSALLAILSTAAARVPLQAAAGAAALDRLPKYVARLESAPGADELQVILSCRRAGRPTCGLVGSR